MAEPHQDGTWGLWYLIFHKQLFCSIAGVFAARLDTAWENGTGACGSSS